VVLCRVEGIINGMINESEGEREGKESCKLLREANTGD